MVFIFFIEICSIFVLIVDIMIVDYNYKKVIIVNFGVDGDNNYI